MIRNQFTFYKSFYETIESLSTNKAKLQAYQALCAYSLYGAEPELHAIKSDAATVFRIARPVLDAARQKAEAGQKGGLAEKANAKQDKEKEKEKDIYQVIDQ